AIAWHMAQAGTAFVVNSTLPCSSTSGLGGSPARHDPDAATKTSPARPDNKLLFILCFLDLDDASFEVSMTCMVLDDFDRNHVIAPAVIDVAAIVLDPGFG